MSQQAISAAPSQAATQVEPDIPPLSSRAAIVAAAVVVGALAKVAFLYWHAPYDKSEVVPYNTFLGIRRGWYISHYFGGTAMGLGFIALAIIAALIRGRLS
jgi:hypothetical protein